MEMTIDKAIEHGKEQLDIFGGEHKEFIRTAINTMRKYQKIEEIVDEWKHDHDNLNYADDSYYWSKVREVLENGNDD